MHTWLFAGYMVPTDIGTRGARLLTHHFRSDSHYNATIMSCSVFSNAGVVHCVLARREGAKCTSFVRSRLFSRLPQVCPRTHPHEAVGFSPPGTFESYHVARHLLALNGRVFGFSSMPFSSVDHDPSASGDLNTHSVDLRTGMVDAERASR